MTVRFLIVSVFPSVQKHVNHFGDVSFEVRQLKIYHDLPHFGHSCVNNRHLALASSLDSPTRISSSLKLVATFSELLQQTLSLSKKRPTTTTKFDRIGLVGGKEEEEAGAPMARCVSFKLLPSVRRFLLFLAARPQAVSSVSTQAHTFCRLIYRSAGKFHLLAPKITERTCRLSLTHPKAGFLTRRTE